MDVREVINLVKTVKLTVYTDCIVTFSSVGKPDFDSI